MYNIDATRTPWLYFLKDLDGVKKSGRFYEAQMKLAPLPLAVEVSGTKMSFEFGILILLDCTENCEEFILVGKCVTLALLIIIIGWSFKVMKII